MLVDTFYNHGSVKFVNTQFAHGTAGVYGVSKENMRGKVSDRPYKGEGSNTQILPVY